jgi:hypothetical protein
MRNLLAVPEETKRIEILECDAGKGAWHEVNIEGIQHHPKDG